MVGRNDDCLPDRKFTIVLEPQRLAQAILERPAESEAVRQVDSSIHEAEAVRGTHDGVRLQIEDVSVRDVDVAGIPNCSRHSSTSGAFRSRRNRICLTPVASRKKSNT